MADISVTAANVKQTSGSSDTGIAASAITAGQPVYRDPTTGLLAPARANAAATSTVVGIAINSAPGAGQPVTYAKDGIVAFGSLSTAGTTVVLSSAAAGAIAPEADITTAGIMTVLGVSDSANLKLAINNSGVVHA